MMTVEQIKKMLESGVCPICNSEVEMDEDAMTIYRCTGDPDHFILEVEFGEDGNSLKATLNGESLKPEELEQISW